MNEVAQAHKITFLVFPKLHRKKNKKKTGVVPFIIRENTSKESVLFFLSCYLKFQRNFYHFFFYKGKASVVALSMTQRPQQARYRAKQLQSFYSLLIVFFLWSLWQLQ